MTTEKVMPFLPSEEVGRIISNRIFVGGLGASFGEKELFHFFCKFGSVEHVEEVTPKAMDMDLSRSTLARM